ncbi:MAG: ribonuclease J, partial [Clostridia bacterium]|nr:ribonuclease J [Clostridia bacterium]
GDVINLGVFKAEFIHVNHSIADACAIAIKTPVGVVYHSGDFKLDVTPIDGEMMNLTRLGEIGKKGVLLLMCESTNAERPGHTPSEKKVGASLESIFASHKRKRIIIATFSSNVHRIQHIITSSVNAGRKVAVTGRSMINIVSAAVDLGYMNIPEGTLIDISESRKYPPEKLTVISTGSQGEPMSALYRMAFNMHDKIELGTDDVVIISASAIPGNEKLVGNIVNELYKKGVRVLNDSVAEVHVSGHACQEELKIIHALTKPQYFMPVHGEARHLYHHKELAEHMGMEPNQIFISENGKILEIGTDGAKFNGTVPAGIILVDGTGVGDVGNVVLRDRRHLSEDGIIIVVATIDMQAFDIVSGPEIVSRGFVYAKESEPLIEQIRMIAREALYHCLDKGVHDWAQLKFKMKEDLSKFIYSQTKRKPMILPIIMDI